jgi:cobalt-precorrin-5B (C1)-methyltransferase
VASRNRTLRSGYTTGACAAAAAKAALLFLVGSFDENSIDVEIPFPDGTRRALRIEKVLPGEGEDSAWASIIKDAGDDPDVTDGIEIRAMVRLRKAPEGIEQGDDKKTSVLILGGEGVGRVTLPGLSVSVGEPAINPVPKRMIEEAVKEALDKGKASPSMIEVNVSVPGGEKIARKTLNSRLGILGGISILGTTGIVRPVSSEAWIATISASMDVAKAMGREEIVLSSGRSSEKAHMARYGFSDEAYAMMGDYVEYAMKEAGAHGFRKIHLCAQWGKMLKVAMAIPQTHVRHGAIDLEKTMPFLQGLGFPDFQKKRFNTARELFNSISEPAGAISFRPLLKKVCSAASAYAESLSTGVPVQAHLVGYDGEIIAEHG